mmetsp:Transcript_57513/g.167030  ORF Transcript_57513/g.167030 Transcript_57513/m.167030 type:complete len:81 (-) Transcript_57513:100-342(-)
MGNKTSPHQLSNQNRQVWSNCIHSVLQVFKELSTILSHRQHLFGKSLNVNDIKICNFSSHTDFCGLFDGSFYTLVLDNVT